MAGMVTPGGEAPRTRSWWGWGYDDAVLDPSELGGLARLLRDSFGIAATPRDPPDLGAVDLPSPRLVPPASLAHLVSDVPADRVRHAYGSSFRDIVRSLDGRIDHPPDLVARPTSAAEVVDVLDWCSSSGVAAIPYGGGTSVVGGVEPDVGDGYAGTVSVDLAALDGLIELDRRSLAARIGAGTLGPALEDALRPHGLTLRFFPQSFECSTLGGWIATRAGGHFATGPTHIDDLVEAMGVVTPAGIVETRRLPASGAGPSPDRLFLGSEGALGIITDAWVRVRPRPRFRAGGSATFASLFEGAEAVRALAQSGLAPTNCRLIDPVEAMVNGVGDGSGALLIVGFESADHPVDGLAARAAELVRDHGGTVDEDSWHHPGGALDVDDLPASPGSAASPGSPGSASAGWRGSFIRAPYLRDGLVRLGMMVETFETAVTWDRFEDLHAAVTGATLSALAEVGASGGFVTCRTTHAYPDGVAPYFTVIAPGRPGGMLSQWDTVKAAASEALLASGGTITHHHAVGRDHRPFYDRQRPELFAAALRGAKAVLDPSSICNPGVLLPAG